MASVVRSHAICIQTLHLHAYRTDEWIYRYVYIYIYLARCGETWFFFTNNSARSIPYIMYTTLSRPSNQRQYDYTFCLVWPITRFASKKIISIHWQNHASFFSIHQIKCSKLKTQSRKRASSTEWNLQQIDLIAILHIFDSFFRHKCGRYITTINSRCSRLGMFIDLAWNEH